MSSTVFAYKTVSDKFGRVGMLVRKRRQLPVADVSSSLVGVGDFSGADVKVGDRFLTVSGHYVRVADSFIGFMDVHVLVEYSNGAVRWLSLEGSPFVKKM